MEPALTSGGPRPDAPPLAPQGSRAVSRAPLGGRGGAGGASASAAFHVELTETCVDLLSRYAFTPCSVKPQRSDTAEFLFGGGQSATWLVGHKLVTITTSGCQQNSIKQGPCDRYPAARRSRGEGDVAEARFRRGRSHRQPALARERPRRNSFARQASAGCQRWRE